MLDVHALIADVSASGGVSLWCVSQNTLKFVFVMSLLILGFIFSPFSTTEKNLIKTYFSLIADADFSQTYAS